MALVDITCDWCGLVSQKERWHVTRARDLGRSLFCNQTCAGLHRRRPRSDEEKREAKAVYDAARRERLAPEIKAAKAKWFQETDECEGDRARERMEEGVEQ